MPDNFQLPKIHKAERINLRSRLQETTRATGNTLLSGIPAHWLTVFLTLSVHMLTHSNLLRLQGYTPAFAPARDTLYQEVERLTGLYPFCCKELHPLNKDIGLEWLALMLGGDCLSLQNYRVMHNAWIEWLADCKYWNTTQWLVDYQLKWPNSQKERSLSTTSRTSLPTSTILFRASSTYISQCTEYRFSINYWMNLITKRMGVG